MISLCPLCRINLQLNCWRRLTPPLSIPRSAWVCAVRRSPSIRSQRLPGSRSPAPAASAATATVRRRRWIAPRNWRLTGPPFHTNGASSGSSSTTSWAPAMRSSAPDNRCHASRRHSAISARPAANLAIRMARPTPSSGRWPTIPGASRSGTTSASSGASSGSSRNRRRRCAASSSSNRHSCSDTTTSVTRCSSRDGISRRSTRTKKAGGAIRIRISARAAGWRWRGSRPATSKAREREFWRLANASPGEERSDLLLEAYEVVHALIAEDPARAAHRGILDRLGAEITKSE